MVVFVVGIQGILFPDIPLERLKAIEAPKT